MLCSRILVAYDGSELGNKALKTAIELAKANEKIEIDVLHVVEVPVLYGEFLIAEPNLRETTLKFGKETLEQVKGTLDAIPNKTRTFIGEGQPAQTIVDHARENDCDLIVMGSRGLGAFKELFLGSVSHNVAQHSPVPVFIVK